MAPALIVVVGLFLVVLVYIASIFEIRQWRRSLVAFRLYLPRNVTVDTAAHWLATIAATTHPHPSSLFLLPPVVLEVQASHQGIAHYILVAPSLRHALLAGIQATLPGAATGRCEDEGSDEQSGTGRRCQR
jgi:hypothetical protein